MLTILLLAPLIGYLIGSIPFGYIIVNLTKGEDIRQTGSGGTGATNVTRKAGKTAGLITLLLDALKGFAAVMIVRWIAGSQSAEAIAIAGVMAIVGHCFPIWLGWRGGKGVATAVGVFLALAPWAVIGTFIVFALIVWRTRYVSLGSIIGAFLVPLAAVIQNLYFHPLWNFPVLLSALCVSSALIIWKHSDNIKRLIAGTENKFGVIK